MESSVPERRVNAHSDGLSSNVSKGARKGCASVCRRFGRPSVFLAGCCVPSYRCSVPSFCCLSDRWLCKGPCVGGGLACQFSLPVSTFNGARAFRLVWLVPRSKRQAVGSCQCGEIEQTKGEGRRTGTQSKLKCLCSPCAHLQAQESRKERVNFLLRCLRLCHTLRRIASYSVVSGPRLDWSGG